MWGGGGGQSWGGGWGGGHGGRGCWRREGWAGAVGAAQGWCGGGGDTEPGKGDGAARREQFVVACGTQTRGERAAWRKAVLIYRSFRYIDQFCTAYYKMNNTF